MKKLYSFLSALLFGGMLSAQIPNSDFEDWDFQPVPLQWETNSRPLTLPPYDPYVVKKDTDRYTGNFAADLFGNGVFKPFAKTTFEVHAHPNHLSLYYKLNFAPCVNDSGYIQQDTVSVVVELLNNGTVVDQGSWMSVTTNFTYTHLTVPISQNANLFDSCRITLWGGKVFGGCGFAPAGTEFRVDHLELKYSAVETCIDSSKICDSCGCPANYDPVCGCNGITYSNDCEASIAGVTSWTNGVCGAHAGGQCQAQFTFYKHIDTVWFQNYSTAAQIIGYNWNFGDGFSSALENPQHIYTHDSTYIVCLTLNGLDSSGVSCSSTYCDTIIITHACIDSSLICQELCCDFGPYIPVCGCDSVTYSNPCYASNLFGVSSFYYGTCVTTGINNILQSNGIYLSPVPATDKLNLQYELKHAGNIQISITNMLGQEIKTFNKGVENSGKYSMNIDLTDVAAGTYLISVKNEAETHLKKFVKE